MSKKGRRDKIRQVEVEAKGQIPRAKPPAVDRLVFSFRHLDLRGNEKFSLSLAEDGYLQTLLERLRDVCQMPFQQFLPPSGKTLRSHEIDWSETTEDGFPIHEQLSGGSPWQFALTSNKHGRVHGILIGHLFSVIWLDPAHNLYK